MYVSKEEAIDKQRQPDKEEAIDRQRQPATHDSDVMLLAIQLITGNQQKRWQQIVTRMILFYHVCSGYSYSNSREAEASRAMIAFRSRPLYRGSTRDCMGCRTCEYTPLGVRGARTCVFASQGMRDPIVYCGFNRRRNEHTES